MADHSIGTLGHDYIGQLCKGFSHQGSSLAGQGSGAADFTL